MRGGREGGVDPVEGVGDADLGGVRACRRSIVRRSAERRETLLHAILSAIFGELPEYGQGRSKEELDDIAGGVGRSIDLCLDAVAAARRLREDERVALHLTGGQRARQGIPKSVVLDSVKVATRVGRTFFMTCADKDTDPDVLMAAYREISRIIDWFEDDATAALGEGHDQAFTHPLPLEHREEAFLVDRLLERRFSSDEAALAHCREFGLSTSGPCYIVVVAALEPVDEQRMRAALAELGAHVRLAVGPPRLTHRLHLAVIAQPRDPADWAATAPVLERLARQTSTVLVHGQRPLVLTALAEGYRGIQQGLPFLPAAAGGPCALPAVVLRFHWAMFAGTTADRRQLLHEIVGPLYELPIRHRQELLETVDALYVDGGTASGLARRLHLHKNTVGKRLRRVEELTGLDMQRPAERLVLETMLRLRRVAETGLLPSEPSHWWTERAGPRAGQEG